MKVALISSQKDSQNSLVKPSFPGDLSFSMHFIESFKSFLVKSMSQITICSVASCVQGI